MRAFALAAAGYPPKAEFRAQLEMGLGRIAFKAMQWQDAERIYREVVAKHPNTSSAREARYWRAVSHYKGTNDHTVLGQVAEELQENQSDSVWTKKALPWLGE